MDIYYDEEIGAWSVKKEPYICLEIAAKEEYELYKKNGSLLVGTSRRGRKRKIKSRLYGYGGKE